MNVLDRLLTAVVPGLALRRQLARINTAQLRNAGQVIRAYESGGIGRRFGGLKDRATSANTEIARSLPRMRNRHRALIRDNPWAQNANRAIVTNTIGHGITSQIFNDLITNDDLTKLWLKWGETTDCDVAGQNHFNGLQDLGFQTVCESGEVLARRRWRRLQDGLVVPLQIELLEPDYLDHTKNQTLANGSRIVQGVEFDAQARRVAYWLFNNHPGDTLFRRAAAFQSTRVDARDIAHLYRVDRPQQVRGVPWGHAAMLTLYDLDGFEDAFLFRQKLANCFMAIETGDDMKLGEDDDKEQPLDNLEPGIVYRPKAGRELTFNRPPLAAEYGDYVDRVLYRIAAAYGVSYQALTGNLENVNFSSGRMGWQDFQRNIDRWRRNMIIPRFCNKIAGWFLEAAILSGHRVPDETRFVWTSPRREMIDPAKEIPPLRDAIRAGITSLPAVHRQFGEHTARVLAEIESTNKILDDKKLILDSDPRNVSAAGLAQPGTTLLGSD